MSFSVSATVIIWYERPPATTETTVDKTISPQRPLTVVAVLELLMVSHDLPHAIFKLLFLWALLVDFGLKVEIESSFLNVEKKPNVILKMIILIVSCHVYEIIWHNTVTAVCLYLYFSLCRVTQTSRCPRFYVTWRTVRWCSWTGGTF